MIGLLAIVDSAASGASFVGNGGNGASMSMAVGAAVGVGAYALVLLMSASYAFRQADTPARSELPGPAPE